MHHGDINYYNPNAGAAGQMAQDSLDDISIPDETDGADLELEATHVHVQKVKPT